MVYLNPESRSLQPRYPAIVFYSEIFQRTAPIIRAASYLAGHGFVVAVPEIYHDTDGAAGYVNIIRWVCGYYSIYRDTPASIF